MSLAYAALAAGAFALVNLAGAALMAQDKRAARLGRRRVPEARLLVLAWAGGGAGSLLAGRATRHKTRKQPFRRRQIAATLLSTPVWVWALWTSAGLG